MHHLLLEGESDRSQCFLTLRDEVGLLREREKKKKVVALIISPRSIDWILKLIGRETGFHWKDVSHVKAALSRDRREIHGVKFLPKHVISFIDRPTATRYIIPKHRLKGSIEGVRRASTTTTLPLRAYLACAARREIMNETRARACTRGEEDGARMHETCIDFPSRIWGRTTVLRANGESQRIRHGRESVESETKLACERIFLGGLIRIWRYQRQRWNCVSCDTRCNVEQTNCGGRRIEIGRESMTDIYIYFSYFFLDISRKF